MNQQHADKRSVATDALETLGTIIDASQKRDAIHLAVIPMQAITSLMPGCHVDKQGELAEPYSPEAVGIVDPFLRSYVREGEFFWLVIYPRVITSLRHVWAHPAFSDESSSSQEEPKKAASEAWLRNFISKSDCPDYETVIAIASGEKMQLAEDYGYSRHEGEYLFFSGIDAHGEIPPEFWDHLEVITGRRFGPDERATHFSCSC